MKFEEFLIQQPIPSDGRRRRLALQEEVEELQDRLDGELRLNKALRRAMKQADGDELPLPLQLLLAELDTVEEEILWLERRLNNLIHIQSAPTSMPMPMPMPMDTHEALISSSSSRSLCFGPEHPNTISEELLRCLMSVFLKMSSDQLLRVSSGKHTAGLSSCIIHNAPSAHPPAASDGLIAYKGYTHVTRASFAKPRNTLMPRISVLLKKLCHVDLAFLNYKQKLAFWINVYNACIMNAYLQHGLPSTQDKMLSLMIKAALNVGGIVLNALAIEHYILRHPHDQKQDVEEEKEILLRRAYGLRYPEPNVTFALCRGNWSSPALKVYSAEEVVNELEKVKVEYLEAWVGVRRSKKKIVLPKLVRWHMRDFADDLESLIEWIYSQLPHNSLGGLKTRIMECLINSQMKPIRNMVEILPYQYEFRYLIPTPLHKP